MSAQGWCNAITLTAQLSARTRQQRYGAFAPQRMPAAPKEGDRHLLRDLDGHQWIWKTCWKTMENGTTSVGSARFFERKVQKLSTAWFSIVIVLWNRCPATHRGQCFTRYLINGNAIFRSVAEAILLAKHEIFILSFYGQSMVNFLKVFHTCFTPCFTMLYFLWVNLTSIFCPWSIRSRFFLESSHRIGTRWWASTSRCMWFQGLYTAEICSSSRSQSLCTTAFWSLNIEGSQILFVDKSGLMSKPKLGWMMGKL